MAWKLGPIECEEVREMYYIRQIYVQVHIRLQKAPANDKETLYTYNIILKKCSSFHLEMIIWIQPCIYT